MFKYPEHSSAIHLYWGYIFWELILALDASAQLYPSYLYRVLKLRTAIIIFLGLVFFTDPASAQRGSQDLFDTDFLEEEDRFLVVPSIYYLPETRWYFGLGGFYYFNTNREDSITRTSQIKGAAGYTLNNQIVFWMPYDIFFKENKYLLRGELGFYRWPYFYNGIGNGAPVNYEETYTAVFPRFRTAFLKRLGDHIYTGPQYWFQYLSMVKTETNGKLEEGAVPGGSGGANSGLGWVVTYDSRNNVFGPTKGTYAELAVLYNQKAIASDFNYNTYEADLRKYINLGGDHILALQYFGEFHFGNPPFNQMALLGGNKMMRGYREGRFRDKHMMVAQVEYRTPFWYRFGAVAFAGYGGVSDKIPAFSLNHFKYSLGGGLRFNLDKKEGLSVRLDYGIGEGKQNRNFYFTVSEAF